MHKYRSLGIILLISSIFIVIFFTQSSEREGRRIAKSLVELDVWNYLATKEVSSPLAQELDLIFEKSDIQQAFQDLDTGNFDAAVRHLQNNGFIFLSTNVNVLTHKKFPNYVFKIPRDRYQFLLTIGRIWCAELIENYADYLSIDVIVPDKKLYFLPKKGICDRLLILVVADKINLNNKKPLTQWQLKAIEVIQEWLGNSDFHAGNVINCDEKLVFIDTEPWDMKESLGLLTRRLKDGKILI